jgi:hypothetical protein
MSKSKKSTDPALIASQIEFPPNTTDDPKFLIDAIFLSHELHLITGPDGERGKRNTFTYQLLADWSQGLNVFNGFVSHPVPFSYVCYGRTPEATTLALQKLNITVDFHPVYLSSADAKDLTNIVKLAREAVPDVRLIVLDSISALCPGSRDNTTVTNMLIVLKDICRKNGITIIGVGSYPKAKAGEQYPNVRDRISGGGAFSQFTETMISVEAMAHKRNPNYMVVASIGSSEEEQEFPFHWDDDLHKLMPGFIRLGPTWRNIMDEWLSEFKPSEVISTEDITKAADERVDVKRASVFMWITEKRDEGRIMSQERGKYIIRRKA